MLARFAPCPLPSVALPNPTTTGTNGALLPSRGAGERRPAARAVETEQRRERRDVDDALLVRRLQRGLLCCRGLLCRWGQLPKKRAVNNAGVEFAAAFASQPPEELRATIEINLCAPLLLTRRVLPGMLERARGHVVFVASLAGKAPTPYEAVYAASKAGLIGLTRSLRVEYRAALVGLSVVCPGFVAGDGMYQRMVEHGVTSNRILGDTTTDKIAAAVLDAIRHDRSQVIESGAPIKPLLALGELAPRTFERIVVAAGAAKIFRASAAACGLTQAPHCGSTQKQTTSPPDSSAPWSVRVP